MRREREDITAKNFSSSKVNGGKVSPRNARGAGEQEGVCGLAYMRQPVYPGGTIMTGYCQIVINPT